MTKIVGEREREVDKNKNQSLTLKPQMLVRLIPTVGLAILENMNLLISMFGRLRRSLDESSLLIWKPNRSRYLKEGIIASFLGGEKVKISMRKVL